MQEGIAGGGASLIERRESSKEKMETEPRTVKSVKSRSIIKKKKKKVGFIQNAVFTFIYLFIIPIQTWSMEYSSGIIIIKYSLLNIRFRPHSSKSIHLYIYISSNSITPNSAHAFAFTQRSFIASIINARLRLLKQRNS